MELGPGKVAVVTGAAGGIGLALANAFAAAGCSIVLADVDQEALDAAAAEVGAHGVETLSVVTDVSKAEAVEALAAATMERSGRCTWSATTLAWAAPATPGSGRSRPGSG